MKKIILTLMAVMISIVSFAQQPGGQRREFKPEDTAKRRADQIKESAKINDEQYELLVLQFSQDKDVRLKAEQAQRERLSSKMEAKAAVAVEEPKKVEPRKETPVAEEKPAVSF